MQKNDKYLLEELNHYIEKLDPECNYETKEYSPLNDKSGRGNKIILKILCKEDKDIIIYSYEEYV
ncbi:MAG: hypothetical protein K9K76_09065 [Halanaerobiales bacterium]|nr:hypothetical protein [Halanaerobiales bacterium]